MGRVTKVYLSAVFGALGGLAASYLHQHLLLNTLAGQLGPWSRFGYLTLLGILIGGAIGFVPSLSEGLGTFSVLKVLRAGAIGAACGAAGGLIALPLAELLHVQMGGGTRSRMFALALFGTAIGVAEGINGGARWWRGLVGGAVGGAIAGMMLEALLSFTTTYSGGGIWALVLIGMFVTLTIALFVNVLSEAWIEDMYSSGQVYHLGKYKAPSEAIIGSEKKGTVFVFVPSGKPRHASISLTNAGCRLKALAPDAAILVNGNPIQECILVNNDVIDVGGARFRYRESRKTTWVGVQRN
jgi:hypothetical protein